MKRFKNFINWLIDKADTQHVVFNVLLLILAIVMFVLVTLFVTIHSINYLPMKFWKWLVDGY